MEVNKQNLHSEYSDLLIAEKSFTWRADSSDAQNQQGAAQASLGSKSIKQVLFRSVQEDLAFGPQQDMQIQIEATKSMHETNDFFERNY